jgi:hypothetical protein
MSDTLPPTSIADKLGEPQKLERVKGLSPEDFMEQYIIPGKPAIIEDAIDHWPALKKWTPEFWIQNYGEKKVTIDGKEYSIEEVIHLALESKPESPAPYYRNTRLRLEYPELMPDIRPYPVACGPNWFHSSVFFPIRERIVGGGGHYELFIGGRGRSFPFLHFDAPGAHTFIHQIAGRKSFILFSPEDTPYLYPCKEKDFSVSGIRNIEDVDLEKFPLYANATRYDDEAGPGDSLFMPSGWWHTAKMSSFSISLGIDVANRSNWDHVLGYMNRRAGYENPILAAAYMSYMRCAGSILNLTNR